MVREVDLCSCVAASSVARPASASTTLPAPTTGISTTTSASTSSTATWGIEVGWRRDGVERRGVRKTIALPIHISISESRVPTTATAAAIASRTSTSTARRVLAIGLRAILDRLAGAVHIFGVDQGWRCP